MTFSAAEADRQIANVLQVGKIVSIDNPTGRARVQVGDLLLPPVPVMQLRSGAIRMHWMPSVGEQVLLPRVRERDPGTAVLADGFSCRTQVAEFAGVRPQHLAELLAAGMPRR